MRILQVIPSIDPTHGGVSEAVVRMSAELARSGHSVEIVTTDAPNRPWNATAAVRVHALGPSTAKYAYTPRLASWLSKNCRRFDVALVHSLWNYASLAARRACKRAGTPYVVFPHGMLSPWFRELYPVKHLAKQVYWTLAQGKVLADAEVVIFTAEEELRKAAGAFVGHPYRSTVLGLGTAEPPPVTETEHQEFRIRHGLVGRRFLLFMGRLHPVKGCDLLIDAFAALSKQHPDVDLVIAGPDPAGLRASLSTQAARLRLEPRVRFTGMLAGSEKWAAFRASEAFVLPSHQENFAVVVAEAMACGKPVLITDKVNVWPVIAESGSGFVDTDTTAGVTALLERFLSLPAGDVERMSDAARLTFEAEFTAERAVSRLMDILRDHGRVAA